VSEGDAFTACRQIARTEGLLVGISSGAVAHTAGKIVSSAQYTGKVIVGIFADRGERYLSVQGLFD
jgi:cysteine synthase A